MLNKAALFIPLFLLIVLVEWYISHKSKNARYRLSNTSMNLTIGAIDQICSLFYFGLLYIVLQYVYNHFKIFNIPNLWYQWVVGYVAVDFISYWYHRFSHRVNILWAGHVTHHSSELFNLSNGFRTSPFQGLNRIVFWAFLPVFGFSPLLLVLILKVSGIYDFLQHTQYVPKLGWIEKVLITPSIHRAHHGKNDIYIDKNYGSTFLIWDQLFGTYQPETEKIVYGIKSEYTDTSPLKAISNHYLIIWRQVKSAKTIKDILTIVLMAPEHSASPIQPTNYSKTIGGIMIKPGLRYPEAMMLICIAATISLLVFREYLPVWQYLIFSMVCIGAMTYLTISFTFKTNKEVVMQ